MPSLPAAYQPLTLGHAYKLVRSRREPRILRFPCSIVPLHPHGRWAGLFGLLEIVISAPLVGSVLQKIESLWRLLAYINHDVPDGKRSTLLKILKPVRFSRSRQTAAEFGIYFLNCTPCPFVSFYVAFGRIFPMDRRSGPEGRQHAEGNL